MKLLILAQTVDSNDPIMGFFVDWVREFARHCEHVDIICLKKGRHDLPANVQIWICGKENGVRSQIKLGIRMAALVKKLLPQNDVIFSHMCPEYVLIAAPFARAQKKKIVMWYTHGHVSLRLRLADKVSHKICTASDRSLRLDTPRKVILGHGVDADFFRPKNDRITARLTKNLVYVGRISPVKKIEVLIDAIKILEKEIPGINLKIIGPATLPDQIKYLSELKSRAQKINAPVTFHEPVEHGRIRDIFRAADIFINPSRTGSIDKTTPEAMSCGTMVLSCNQSFMEILPPECLYRPDDSQNLADQVLKFAQMKKADQEKLLGRLREFVVTNYSLQNLIPQILQQCR